MFQKPTGTGLKLKDNFVHPTEFKQPSAPSSVSKRCLVRLLDHQLTENYRYMFQKIDEKYKVLDDRIELFSGRVKDHYNIEELFDPLRPTQEAIKTIGRICCDTEGKLNSQSVVLETSRSLGAGCRVSLNLDEVPSFALFPGRVVAVEGINSTGRALNVTNIYENPLLPMSTSLTSELMEYNYGPTKLNGQPMTIVIASGPYTLNTNLQYQPFLDFINKMKTEKPDVLILLGPFVDQDHPLIKSGNLDSTLEDIFVMHISAPLQSFCHACPGTSVIMVPSAKDIIHSHMAFPQPPLEGSGTLKIPQEVLRLPNPCQFRINEVIFAVSTVDVLFHLSAEEAPRDPKPDRDRMGRLAYHILEQRSLYPLFPPARGEVNLDLKHHYAIELQVMPDVLILPSRLKFFAKTVEEVVCVNPGHLTKSQTGGTYAKMTILPSNKEEISSNEVKHHVADRATVDIIKI
ncbi:1626_t:CDS:10 [Paraglomus occultum]|uniref:DNA polymerase alpha subunit B n=1 Tax=Paraglomus occultum TaxID=144539 RepID=A0A9N8YUL8_9GLOM|nr:1626_t:CDS:10 [Paraglomus occultum]